MAEKSGDQEGECGLGSPILSADKGIKINIREYGYQGKTIAKFLLKNTVVVMPSP